MKKFLAKNKTAAILAIVGLIIMTLAVGGTFVGLEVQKGLRANSEDPVTFITLNNTTPVVTGDTSAVAVTSSLVTITKNGNYFITGETTTRGVKVNSGLNNVHITIRDVTVTLSSGNPLDIIGAKVWLTMLNQSFATNSFIAGNTTSQTGGWAGIRVPVGAELTITAESTGTMLVCGGHDAYSAGSGIGGNKMESAGTVNIYGGGITATGAVPGGASGVGVVGAAGIGGGCAQQGTSGGAGGTVNIYGGIINAIANAYASGIGPGPTAHGMMHYPTGLAAGGTVNIYGGTVAATGHGSSIGSSTSTLNIYGGTVHRPNGGATPTGIAGNVAYLVTLTLPAINTFIVGGSLKRGAGPVTEFAELYAAPDAMDFALNNVLPYGAKHMRTDSTGNLFMYLPTGSYEIELWDEEDNFYFGTVAVNTSGGTITTWSTLESPKNINIGGAAIDGGGPDGSISGDIKLLYGKEGEITINAGTGYKIDAIKIGGETVTIKDNAGAAVNYEQLTVMLEGEGETDPEEPFDFAKAKAWYMTGNKQMATLMVKDLKIDLDGDYAIEVFASLISTGGGDDPGDDNPGGGTSGKYLIIIDDGEKKVLKEVTPGGTVEMPAEPKRDGHEFIGWFYIGLDGKEYKFDPNTPIALNRIIYAGWEPVDAGDGFPNLNDNSNKTKGVDLMTVIFIVIGATVLNCIFSASLVGVAMNKRKLKRTKTAAQV